MVNGESGKGGKPRPVNPRKWSEGYDRAFGKKESAMQNVIPSVVAKCVAKVVAALELDVGIRRATYYVGPKMTVKATRQRRVDGRSRQETLIVTFGSPNFAERKFIKACLASGEPFPVKKVQLTWWPIKKAASNKK